jgi:hypothetical protein
MKRNITALSASAAVCAALLLAGSAAAQFGPARIPNLTRRPFLVHAQLIRWAGADRDEAVASVAALLASDQELPETLQVISSVSGHALRSYSHRLVRDEQSDLILTFSGRERRRMRALLEVEGAPPEQALTLEVRLDRSYGAARGRLVKALGASGPWLRIDVFRP